MTTTNAALVEYANPLNWDVDENGIRRVWKEPGSETPEAYNGFELAKAALSTAAHPTAGIWVPTELAERVQETMGEFLMDHGWRQQDMDTSDEFGALLAVATKSAPAAQGDARAEQALLKVLTAVQRYLPPDGPSAKDTLAEIIGIIDPWPLGDQKGKA